MTNIAKLTSFILLQIFAAEVSLLHAQTLSQYLQLAGLGAQPSPAPAPSSPCPLGPPSYPASSYPPPNYQQPNHQPSYQVPNPQSSYQVPNPHSSYQVPNPQPSYQVPSHQPTYQSAPRSPSPQPNSLPAPLSAIASLAASIPVPSPLPKAPANPKPTESIPASGIDSNVLNNLAIALQLLIVSNILNTPTVDASKLELPKFESIPSYETVPISPLPLSYPVQSALSLQSPYLEPSRPNLYSYESQNLPNSNFLGTSGFVESPMFGSAVSAKPNPRSSMTLMSPYEALGPNSPYSDPILSSVYSPSYSKKDFQSPYASILAADGHRDLFSVSDLF